jgi:hypothetical protein
VDNTEKRAIWPSRQKPLEPEKLPKPWVVHYTAGLFDGEGCVLERYRPSGSLVINCTTSQTAGNHGQELFTWLQSEWGIGRIGVEPKKKNASPCFHWTVAAHREVVYFLEAIEPYLFVKKDKAQRALDLLKSLPCRQKEFDTLRCDGCQKEFLRYLGETIIRNQGRRHVFCSRTCYLKFLKEDRSRRVDLICPVCGEAFERSISKVARSGFRFCSIKCSGEYHRGRELPSWAPRAETACAFCAAKITRRVSKLRQQKGNLQFCGRECYHAHQRINRVTIPCAVCSRDITRQPSQFHGQNGVHCCSVECARIYRTQKVSATCAYCSCEFARPPSQMQAKSGLHFCSAPCWRGYRKQISASDIKAGCQLPLLEEP